MNDITFVIISYNTRELTCNCIESILNTTNNNNIEIILVDNASSDDTCMYISNHYPQITIIQKEKNLGYSAAINAGVAKASSEIIFLCNSDIVFHNKSISDIINAFSAYPQAAAFSCQQIYLNGSWQSSYDTFPGWKLALKKISFFYTIVRFLCRLTFNRKHLKNIKKVDYLDGAMFAVRKSDFNSVAGFDESYFFYTEECDFFKRLKKMGKYAYLLKDSRITHVRGGATSKTLQNSKVTQMLIDSKALFCKKHLTSFEIKFYFMSEIFYFFILKLVNSIIILFVNKTKKEYLSKKIELFDYTIKAWISNYNLLRNNKEVSP